ncbi:O-antigen ligase family protein [Sphingobium yanoikuyae]|nr:hypothetical protein [Sphingobium yanoikuyae]
MSLGLNFLYAELVAFSLLASVLFRNRIYKVHTSILIAVLTLILFASAAIVVTDNQAATFSSVRNIASALVALTSFAMIGFEARTKLLVLKAFVLAGIGVSLLGIHQALFGFDQSITVYSLGLTDNANAGISFALNWKLDNLVKSGLVTVQKSLSIGLHQYSNNFAEFLIYVQIAVITLSSARSISKPTFVILYGIIFSAVVLTQSRTCQIAFILLSVVQLLWITRNLFIKLSYALLTFIIALILLPLAISAVEYDGLKTVEGRGELNSASLSAIGHSVTSIMFGGHTKHYYDEFVQDPHNMFLYLALQFGIPFAVLAAGFFLYILYQMSRPEHDETLAQRALRRGGLIATVWLLGYGMTWSVISVGSAGMTWAMLTGLALPRRWLDVPPRVAMRRRLSARGGGGDVTVGRTYD